MLFLLAFLICTTSTNSLTCHCLNGSQCQANGFCVQGCEPGWYGPGCQIGNVALGKQANQSTTYTDFGYVCSADRAVDGILPINDTTVSCTHTFGEYDTGYPGATKKGSAWWMVTLDTTHYYVISNVTIVNQRGYNSIRLANFVILYSNETDGDPNPINSTWLVLAREYGTVENNRTYTCNNTAIAKRIAVYLTAFSQNSGAILTLCEVQIYGYEHYDCPTGFTGPGCLLRACNHCGSTGGNCTGDFGSCRYDVCPDQSLLPPDCWITLSNFSGLSILSTATCNSVRASLVLPDSQPNIAATLLQLQMTTSADRSVLENATLSVQRSNPASYNFSSATADTSYNVSVKLLYCHFINSSCFHTTESKVFTVLTGKREYIFTRNNSCIFINVSSATHDCELPSAIQVTCEAQVTSGVTVNSSGLTTCGLERDLAYNCSMAAFISANRTERRSSNISAGLLYSSHAPENDNRVLAGSIGGSAAIIVVTVAIVAFVYYRSSTRFVHAEKQLLSIVLCVNCSSSHNVCGHFRAVAYRAGGKGEGVPGSAASEGSRKDAYFDAREFNKNNS